MHFNLFYLLASFSYLVGDSNAGRVHKGSPLDLAFETVQQIPGTSSLENLAVRHTGDILVTSLSSHVLHQISPINSNPPVVVASIPAVFGLVGIAELARDKFYVIGSNITGLTAAPTSNQVWEVDMRRLRISSNGTVKHPARVSLVASLPEAQLLNGMSRFAPDDNDHVLLADSVAGTITKLNVHTGRYSVVARDPTMLPLPSGLGLGINGIHVNRQKVYYTSLDQGIFASIDISPKTGALKSKPEVLVSGILTGDDFAQAPQQSSFIKPNRLDENQLFVDR